MKNILPNGFLNKKTSNFAVHVNDLTIQQTTFKQTST